MHCGQFSVVSLVIQPLVPLFPFRGGRASG